MKLYVKFVRYNVNTIHSILSGKVYFPTVFQLNDFNELNYIHGGSGYEDKHKDRIEDLFSKEENRCDIPYKLFANNRTEELCERLGVWLKSKYSPQEKEIPKEFRQALCEYMAFNSVGILSLSDFEVFKGSEAQVMFAHYADNLEGLALIYKTNKTLHKVRYEDTRHSSGGNVERFFRWLNHEYTPSEMSDFLRKATPWEYEREFRLFKKPGLHSLEDVGLELKAIFHTARFPKENLNFLKEQGYSEKLLSIYPGYDEMRKFKAGGEDVENLEEMLLSEG